MSKHPKTKVELDGTTIAVLKALVHQIEQHQKANRTRKRQVQDSTVTQGCQLQFSDIEDSDETTRGEEH